MKFTLSWLRDHLDTKATVDEIATTLSAIGLKVEGVEDPAKALGAFTIARIVEAESIQTPTSAGRAGRGRQGPAADGSRLRRAERARGHARSVRSARDVHPGVEDYS